MTSYISRVFSRPSVVDQATPPPPLDRETEREHEDQSNIEDDLNHIEQDNATHHESQSFPPTSSKSRASSSQVFEAPNTSDQGSQFQVMTISTLITQNSNLLAQNLEMSRENERLRAGAMKDMEVFKKELREEVRGMIKDAIQGLVDTLGELRPTPRPTPPAVVSSLVEPAGTQRRADSHEFSDLIYGHLEGGSVEMEPRRDEGKQKAINRVDREGIDPNILKTGPSRPTFAALDASVSDGGSHSGQGQTAYDGWMNEIHDTQAGSERDLVAGTSQRIRSTESTENTMTNTQLSAIAQQVVDIQNGNEIEDEGRASPPITERQDGPSTPSRSGRPVRQSATKVGSYRIPLLEDDIGSVSKKGKGQGRWSAKGKGKGDAKSESAIKRKTPSQAGSSQGKRQRTYKGRVSMTARPLGRSDGRKRGDGIWPDKGENTVKGNMQEIVCDICNGRVHWACAGLEDESVPPDEWECPDCALRVAHGVSRNSIEKSPQTQCVRPTCILREKKKIVLKDGDSEEFYVERYIGRRAVGRRADGHSRIFQYLVKWLGYPTNVSTWEHETKFPPNNQFADTLIQDCEAYQVDTKKRVALLPEARRWFDEDGEIIDTDNEGDEEDTIDDNGAGPSQPRPRPGGGGSWR